MRQQGLRLTSPPTIRRGELTCPGKMEPVPPRGEAEVGWAVRWPLVQEDTASVLAVATESHMLSEAHATGSHAPSAAHPWRGRTETDEVPQDLLATTDEVFSAVGST